MNQRASLTSPAVAQPVVRDEVPDPELVALPPPPRVERSIAVVLMLLTALVSAAMCWALRAEVAYAFASARPVDLGDLALLKTEDLKPGTYVEGRALLGTKGAIRYGRPLEGDSFRLQPVAGNPNLWVEVRVPEGMEGPRYVPPSSFAGRLVPMRQAGLRFMGLAGSVHEQTSVEVPKQAWVLSDGSSPRASRWAVALALLLAFFVVWNVTNVIRVLRPVRDA